MKKIYIEWIDSAGYSGWVDDCDFSPLLIKSFGFLLNEDDTSITIASHVAENDTYYAPMTIPKVAIIKRK